MNQLQQNQGQTVTGFLAQAEPAAYQQATASYELPLNIASTEMGLSQPGSVTQNLAPTNPLNVQPANYQGAVAQQQSQLEQNYQANLQQKQAMLSGLFGIPTAVLGGWARAGTPGVSSLFGGGGQQIATNNFNGTGTSGTYYG